MITRHVAQSPAIWTLILKNNRSSQDSLDCFSSCDRPFGCISHSASGILLYLHLPCSLCPEWFSSLSYLPSVSFLLISVIRCLITLQVAPQTLSSHAFTKSPCLDRLLFKQPLTKGLPQESQVLSPSKPLLDNLNDYRFNHDFFFMQTDHSCPCLAS